MATPRTERKPRLAYAANRRLGVRGLDLLLERGWEPVALLLAEGRSESHADEMAERLPNVPVLRGGTGEAPRGSLPEGRLGVDG